MNRNMHSSFFYDYKLSNIGIQGNKNSSFTWDFMVVSDRFFWNLKFGPDDSISYYFLAGDNNVDDDEWQPGNIDFDNEGRKCLSWGDLEGTLHAIQNASLFSSQNGKEISSLVMKLQNLLRCAKVESLK